MVLIQVTQEEIKQMKEFEKIKEWEEINKVDDVKMKLNESIKQD